MTKLDSEIDIPPESEEAAARGLAAVRMPNYTWDDLDREMQQYLRGDARAALQAGLRAWPGVCIRHRSRPNPRTGEWTMLEPMLSLPLQQETDNG